MGKGNERERQCVSIYQRAGYATYRPATVQFGENDVWGLYDVLAISPADPHVHLVQVKSNRAVGIRKWSRHTSLWRSHGFRTLYAVPYDYAGWRLIEATDDGHRTLYDGRESEAAMGDGLTEYLRGDE